jgi:hypothetical protein
MRIGNWLTADQGKRLLTAFGGEDLRSKRDYAMNAVLLGCDLRRAEVEGSPPKTSNSEKSTGTSNLLARVVTFERRQELDGLAGGVDGSVQLFV